MQLLQAVQALLQGGEYCRERLQRMAARVAAMEPALKQLGQELQSPSRTGTPLSVVQSLCKTLLLLAHVGALPPCTNAVCFIGCSHGCMWAPCCIVDLPFSVRFFIWGPGTIKPPGSGFTLANMFLLQGQPSPHFQPPAIACAPQVLRRAFTPAGIPHQVSHPLLVPPEGARPQIAAEMQFLRLCTPP